MLYVALGENNQRSSSQDLDKLQGKIVRLHPDGAIPDDNPFVGHLEARPEIWSYGHRNPQGMALNPWSGQLWAHEHGPRGGDEVNLIKSGRNYGWPLATYGINYTGLQFLKRKAKCFQGPNHRFFGGSDHPLLAEWPFTMLTAFLNGSIHCLSARYETKC